jgi:hypothetical protein
MNAPRDPEAILLAWFEEGPSSLPEQTRRAIKVATRSTAQRRRFTLSPGRWRMLGPLPVSIVAVMALVVVGGALALRAVGPFVVGGPTEQPSVLPSASATAAPPSTSPRASTTPISEPFTSRRYGYRFERPLDWQIEESTRAWGSGEVVAPDLVSLDRFLVPSSVPGSPTAFVGVASQPIAAGDTAETWLDGYKSRFQAANHSQCRPYLPSDWEPSTVAGVTGSMLQFTCDGISITDFIAVHAGRGWVISGDRALVEHLFSSFQFPG